MRYNRLNIDELEAALEATAVTSKPDPIILGDEMIAVRIGPFRFAPDPDTKGAMLAYLEEGE